MKFPLVFITFITTALFWGSTIANTDVVDIIEVNQRILPDFLNNSEKYTILNFYSDQCQYCAKLEPVYHQLLELFGNSKEIQIARINMLKNKKVQRQHEIKSFPTIKLFNKNGKLISTFNNFRTLDNIQKFITDNTNIKPLTLKSKIPIINDSNSKKIFEKDTVLIFLGPWMNDFTSQAMTVFDDLAQHFYSNKENNGYKKNIPFFAKVNGRSEESTGLTSKYRVDHLPYIVYIRKDNPDRPIAYHTNTRFEGGYGDGGQIAMGRLAIIQNAHIELGLDNLIEFVETARRHPEELKDQIIDLTQKFDMIYDMDDDDEAYGNEDDYFGDEDDTYLDYYGNL